MCFQKETCLLTCISQRPLSIYSNHVQLKTYWKQNIKHLHYPLHFIPLRHVKEISLSDHSAVTLAVTLTPPETLVLGPKPLLKKQLQWPGRGLF